MSPIEWGDIAQIACLQIVIGWALVAPEAHLFDPITALVDRALTRRISAENGSTPIAAAAASVWVGLVETVTGRHCPAPREPRPGRLATWIRHGRHCPPCAGFWPGFGFGLWIGYPPLEALGAATVATLAHIIWMRAAPALDPTEWIRP